MISKVAIAGLFHLAQKRLLGFFGIAHDEKPARFRVKVLNFLKLRDELRAAVAYVLSNGFGAPKVAIAELDVMEAKASISREPICRPRGS